jgi:hypothetical protein
MDHLLTVAPETLHGHGEAPTAAPANQTNGNHRAEMLSALAEQLRCAIHDDRGSRYTLHVDFAADDAVQARMLAMALAEGLGILRTEVQTYTAVISKDGRWAEAEPVFCTATGPDGAKCADVVGHPGWHSEAGVKALRWGQADGEGTNG